MKSFRKLYCLHACRKLGFEACPFCLTSFSERQNQISPSLNLSSRTFFTCLDKYFYCTTTLRTRGVTWHFINFIFQRKNSTSLSTHMTPCCTVLVLFSRSAFQQASDWPTPTFGVHLTTTLDQQPSSAV